MKTPSLRVCAGAQPDRLRAIDEFRIKLRDLRQAGHSDRETLIGQVAGHPWYLRIQMNQLRKFPAGERQDALQDALLLFAARLRRDPTLGLSDATQHLLPAYVAQHARSIASSLYRARSRRPQAMGLESLPVTKEPSVADSSVVELIDDFRELLHEDEWFICLLRFRMDWKREHVAAALVRLRPVFETVCRVSAPSHDRHVSS